MTPSPLTVESPLDLADTLAVTPRPCIPCVGAGAAGALLTQLQSVSSTTFTERSLQFYEDVGSFPLCQSLLTANLTEGASIADTALLGGLAKAPAVVLLFKMWSGAPSWHTKHARRVTADLEALNGRLDRAPTRVIVVIVASKYDLGLEDTAAAFRRSSSSLLRGGTVMVVESNSTSAASALAREIDVHAKAAISASLSNLRDALRTVGPLGNHRVRARLNLQRAFFFACLRDYKASSMSLVSAGDALMSATGPSAPRMSPVAEAEVKGVLLALGLERVRALVASGERSAAVTVAVTTVRAFGPRLCIDPPNSLRPLLAARAHYMRYLFVKEVAGLLSAEKSSPGGVGGDATADMNRPAPFTCASSDLGEYSDYYWVARAATAAHKAAMALAEADALDSEAVAMGRGVGTVRPLPPCERLNGLNHEGRELFSLAAAFQQVVQPQQLATRALERLTMAVAASPILSESGGQRAHVALRSAQGDICSLLRRREEALGHYRQALALLPKGVLPSASLYLRSKVTSLMPVRDTLDREDALKLFLSTAACEVPLSAELHALKQAAVTKTGAVHFLPPSLLPSDAAIRSRTALASFEALAEGEKTSFSGTPFITRSGFEPAEPRPSDPVRFRLAIALPFLPSGTTLKGFSVEVDVARASGSTTCDAPGLAIRAANLEISGDKCISVASSATLLPPGELQVTRCVLKYCNVTMDLLGGLKASETVIGDRSEVPAYSRVKKGLEADICGGLSKKPLFLLRKGPKFCHPIPLSLPLLPPAAATAARVGAIVPGTDLSGAQTRCTISCGSPYAAVLLEGAPVAFVGECLPLRVTATAGSEHGAESTRLSVLMKSVGGLDAEVTDCDTWGDDLYLEIPALEAGESYSTVFYIRYTTLPPTALPAGEGLAQPLWDGSRALVEIRCDGVVQASHQPTVRSPFSIRASVISMGDNVSTTGRVPSRSPYNLSVTIESALPSVLSAATAGNIGGHSNLTAVSDCCPTGLNQGAAVTLVYRGVVSGRSARGDTLTLDWERVTVDDASPPLPFTVALPCPEAQPTFVSVTFTVPPSVPLGVPFEAEIALRWTSWVPQSAEVVHVQVVEAAEDMPPVLRGGLCNKRILIRPCETSVLKVPLVAVESGMHALPAVMVTIGEKKLYDGTTQPPLMICVEA